MIKLYEETEGEHVFMRLELNGKIEEIDWYIVPNKYKTTGDNDPSLRRAIIAAFKKLY